MYMLLSSAHNGKFVFYMPRFYAMFSAKILLHQPDTLACINRSFGGKHKMDRKSQVQIGLLSGGGLEKILQFGGSGIPFGTFSLELFP